MAFVTGLVLTGPSAAAAAPAYGAATAGQPSWSSAYGDRRHTGFQPAETVLRPGNVDSLTARYTIPDADHFFVGAAVAAGRGYIYAADTLVSFDAATGGGRRVTRIPAPPDFPGARLEGTPALARGRVFVSSGPSFDVIGLHAVDASTGRILWGSNQRSVTDPTVADGRVYEGVLRADQTQAIVAFDQITGKQLWTSASLGFDAGLAAPAVSGGLLIAAAPQRLVALDADTGAARWRADPDYLAGPAVIGVGLVYAVGYDPLSRRDRITAYDITTGVIRWRTTLPGQHSNAPALAYGQLYVPSDGHFTALDAATGAVRWDRPIPSPRYNFSSPSVANGVVYLPQDDKALVMYATTDGHRLGTVTGSTGPVAIAESTVYIVNSHGLQALRPAR